MASMGSDRCQDCDREFPTTSLVTHGLCPRCQRREDVRFANDMTSADLGPWRFSRRSMQERLGVSGNFDE